MFKARLLSKRNATTTTSNRKDADADADDDEEDEMRTNAGFLPSMVDGLVDAIIILGNAAATSEEVAVGSEEEEQRQHGRDDLLLLRNYASKVLELLLDLLSYPQTRTHVASHISSQNLVVQLRMSK